MFNFHTLGWHSFQQLCLSVSRVVLGQTVQSFLDTNDGGRDGAFSGTWTKKNGESLSGRFVIQCKFTNRVGYSLTPSDVIDEVSKVKRLVSKDECDVYVLMTNAGISAQTDLKLREMFKKSGVNDVLIFGATWLEDNIRENKQLRMMVPRVYGLGDLSQILDERAYAQATSILESMCEELAKVVMTESYRKAAKALDEHKFVLLVGEPASGKTTIASLLAMSSADQWGASVVKLATPRSVVDHWNPHEKTQLFWIDDAFGVTQYERSLASDWNHILNEVKAILRQGNRVVMTSRDYIYNRARQDLKESAFPLFKESQVVIDVHNLTGDERRQILYNHLKLGRQSREFRAAVKPYLESVAQHDRFIPEIARRLADPFFTKKLYLSEWHLAAFVDKREQLLIDTFKELDSDSKAALALIYMANGRLPSPISLSDAEDEAMRRLSSDLGSCTTALAALRGSLVVYGTSDEESFWSFKHPTIGDAYSEMLRASPELLGIYVRGSDVVKLMRQITCGEMDIEGALVLPASFFDLLIKRLMAYKSSPAYKKEWMSVWRARRDLLTFLAGRCSKQFLEAYLSEDQVLIDSIVKPSLYLEFSAEVELAIRLFKLKLLPESARKSLISTVSRYARSGDDARVLHDPELRSLVNEKELTSLLDAVRTEVLPRIEEVRLEHQSGRDPEDDPEWHMRRFTSLLCSIEEEYPQSKRIRNILKRERQLVQEWIDENPTEEDNSTSRNIMINDEPTAESDVNRSIFDDIDQ
jgi:energy-coupling factor transporter ATP-binding protein EcfA2